MKTALRPFQYFDQLSQRYGDVPVVRSFGSVDALNRLAVDPEGRKIAHHAPQSEERLIEFIYSTGGMKRDGNIVEQDGWILDKYRENPQFLWCHGRDGEPLGRSISEWLGRAAGGKALRGIVEFLPIGDNPQADRVLKYYRDGFLNAVSASWKPLRYEIISEEEMKDSPYGENSFFGGVRFTRSEMLEVSACPVPADPDALKKRIQSGELKAEDFTLDRSTEYVYEDGRKTGLFLLDAHEFSADSRTIVDMNTPRTLRERMQDLKTDDVPRDLGQGNDPVSIVVPDSVTELTVRLDALRTDGFVVTSITYSHEQRETDSDAHVADVMVAALNVAFADGKAVTSRHNTTTEWTVQYAPPMTDTAPDPICVPIGNDFRAMIYKPIVDSTEQRGAVPFGAHGRVVVAEEATWDGAGARKRLLEWATADEETDYRKFRKGFAWFDSTRDSTLGGYKLPHHDIIDGEFVTVRGGVTAAAQRVMQGSIDIPEGDYPPVRTHLGHEYELFNEAAPWNRAIGKVYEEIHTSLRGQDVPDRDALQRAAEQIAKDLFGEYRVREPWQATGSDQTPIARFTAVIEDALAYFTKDREVIEELMAVRLQPVIDITANLLSARVEQIESLEREARELKQIIQDAADSVPVMIDFTNLATIRSFLAVTKVTVEDADVDTQLTARMTKLRHVLGETPPQEETGSVFHRILQRLDVHTSRGSSEEEKSDTDSLDAT